jgi:mannose-6-phosphate isomerase-like protein (cupin superfamily)
MFSLYGFEEEPVLRRKEEMEREIRENMRGGKGKVEILHIFKKEELAGKTRLFARLRLEKNCSIGYHNHENEEEVFYIVSGKGRAAEDGKEYEVSEGDAILIQGGGGHTIKNESDIPLEILAVILLYT